MASFEGAEVFGLSGRRALEKLAYLPEVPWGNTRLQISTQQPGLVWLVQGRAFYCLNLKDFTVFSLVEIPVFYDTIGTLNGHNRSQS